MSKSMMYVCLVYACTFLNFPILPVWELKPRQLNYLILISALIAVRSKLFN